MRQFEMVRGLCPRDRIRGAVDGCGRTVGNAGASGHAERPQRKGGRGGRVARAIDAVRRPTAAHRGRCALRRVGYVSALQIRHPFTSGRGVGDAAPYGLCVWVRFSGTVKYVGSLGIVFRIRYVVCRKAGFAAACRVHRPRCTMVT